MFALRQAGYVDIAALQDSCPGHRYVRKSAVTFWNRVLSRIEARDEAASKVVHLGEGMRLATFVCHVYSGSLFDVERVRLEIPVRVGMPFVCLVEQG